MEQDWFEMRDVRRRKLATTIWIPLRAARTTERIGEFGYDGFREEFFGLGSVAIPAKHRGHAEGLDWDEIGIRLDHVGRVDEGGYVPADVFRDWDGPVTGLHLVLDQRHSADPSEWHLHQDLVLALGLKREGDSWVRPDEGYVEVARLLRSEDGSPALLEIRASHLRDYLCARDMALRAASYRHRTEVSGSRDHISWAEDPLRKIAGGDRWEGRVSEVHEGGNLFGGSMAVVHISRTEADSEEDVPTIAYDDPMDSKSWTTEPTGKKLFRIDGELWRNEWVEPAAHSPIVRGDRLPSTFHFVIDAEGTQESADALKGSGRWLWFRPDLIPDLAHRRGGSLRWYTRDTGAVAGGPGSGVHFGMNSLGLVNAYAKDVAYLPEWEQRIWAGHNVAPEGKVSEELFASQARAEPAETQAPEAFLASGREELNRLAGEKLGIQLIRHHGEVEGVLLRTHRFRATTPEGLLALAKDLARLTADSIDAAAIQKIVPPPKNEKWGSLKSLEKLLATKIGAEAARTLMGPLSGIYDLRLADAHLGGKDRQDAYARAGVDTNAPLVVQGFQIMAACVGTIYRICSVLERWDELPAPP